MSIQINLSFIQFFYFFAFATFLRCLYFGRRFCDTLICFPKKNQKKKIKDYFSPKFSI